jgi:acyl-CoA dehydrogenase
MNFEPSARVAALSGALRDFMSEYVYPSEPALLRESAAQPDDFRLWQPLETIEGLKAKARATGLWNLFLPDRDHGHGLTNLEYAPLAEIMGRSYWAPEIFNCDAPNTGNMEVLVRYGTPEQQAMWLEPLLNGTIRSGFAMTEPAVASSDATNIETRITRDGDDYIVSGRKWWTSGAGDPRCRILIVMGQNDPDHADRHARQSMILVPIDTPDVTVRRYLPLFGASDAPHGHMEIVFDQVRVPASNMLLGEGRGFEIAQGRLGPGRIHHCMRLIGSAERALERACRRLASRRAFGGAIADHSVWRQRIGEARCKIDQARLLTLHAAWKMDVAGNKAARAEIAMIKIVAPRMACEVTDIAIQAFGAGGFADAVMSMAYVHARTLRVADGPDEVHLDQLGRSEIKRIIGTEGAANGTSADVSIGQGVDALA